LGAVCLLADRGLLAVRLHRAVFFTDASQTKITKASGGVTLAFAILASYHPAGDIIAATFRRKVVPTSGGRNDRPALRHAPCRGQAKDQVQVIGMPPGPRPP
jgi:hypothetical protein